MSGSRMGGVQADSSHSGTASTRSFDVDVPSCSSSDMAGTSTPYKRRRQRPPGGIRSHCSPAKLVTFGLASAVFMYAACR